MSALIKERPSADAVLAKAVLAAREQLGLTQLELAGIVGVDRSAISRWKTQGLRVDSKTGSWLCCWCGSIAHCMPCSAGSRRTCATSCALPTITWRASRWH